MYFNGRGRRLVGQKPTFLRVRRHLPFSVALLAFSVTGSGGVVIGGGTLGEPTTISGTNVGNTGRIRVLPARNSVRVISTKGHGGM